jgi:beta-galactosidase
MTYDNAFGQRLRICAFFFLAALAVSTPTAIGQTYSPPSNSREDINLDAGWRFIRQDVAGAQTNGFDDSAWTLLNLPHTWNNLDGQDGGNNYYRGIGWYRVHYTVGTNEAGRPLFLKFDGANIVADVYVNGNFVGEHQGGFAAFVYDVTPYMNVGADNVIAVKVNNVFNASIPPLNADFTFFGGIYRDVHLLATDPVQVSPLDYGSPGVYLTTTSVSSNSANLQVTTVVSNASANPGTVTIRAIVTDAATNIVTVLTNIVTLSASSASNVVGSTVISNPHLWNGLSDPYLYQTFIEIYNGSNLTDLVSQPLGFRYFSVDPNNGFFLNGQHYDLHGVNMHQDWLNYGWALTNGQRDANFALLREIGATFLRLSHYEHNDYEYQLADQDGICVWSEVPVIDYITASAAFYTNTLQQLREMIRQRYNHPSVVCWSIYNEVTLQSGPSPITLINLESQLVGQEDPTRFLTEAANTSNNDPTTTNTQVIAFNKYYGWYNGVTTDFGLWADSFHATYPTRSVGITEYGAGASVWQHSEDPVSEPANGGTYHPEEYQNLLHESTWAQMKARPFLWCKLVWNGFDFAADGRGEGDTPGRNDKGLVTYDRQIRKDAFYFYKASWTTNAMVYIAGHTFSNRIANITAKAYSNCGSVQLFVNGVSQGTATSSSNTFLWPVTLQNGTNTVSAIGTIGSTTATDSLVWLVGVVAPPPAGLVSQGKPVTASGFQAGNDPSHGNDGSLTTRWAAFDATYPQWWRVDLGSVQPVTNAVINWYNSSTRAYKYRIEASNDDTNYTVLVNNTGNTTFGDTTNTLSATTRYVRITVTGTTASGGFASFYECKIYGPGPLLPAAPTSLVATAGDAIVSLTWVQSSSPGIITNNVYRSTTGSGGPYGLLTSLAVTTSYVDTTVVNGSNYFYTVTAVSTNGESTMSSSAGSTPLSAFQSWQMDYFGCTVCPQAQPDADPLGKGMSNTNQFLAGLNPTNSASVFRIISVLPLGNDIVVTWQTAGGRSNSVQVTTGDANSSYSNNFVDLPGSMTVMSGSGDTETNYTDVGAATNATVRFYRVRLQ